MGPIALRGPSRAWLTGFVWGCGHAAGVSVLGGIAWLAKDALPLDRLSAMSERLVGVVLVGIGLWALRSALPIRIHVHEHTHGETTHRHVHTHRKDVDHDDRHAHAHTHTHAAAGIGALHGFAGTSHLVGVLPAIALDTRAEAGTYLLGYALGSVAAMTAFAAGLGIIGRRAHRSGIGVIRPLMLTAAVTAILVGVYWLAGA